DRAHRDPAPRHQAARSRRHQTAEEVVQPAKQQPGLVVRTGLRGTKMIARLLGRSSWLGAAFALALTVPAVAVEPPRIEDEELLALLNCGMSEAPSDWK